MVKVGGVGYDPVGDFTVGGRRLTPQHHPALSHMLEAACLCNNAMLAESSDGADVSSLRHVIRPRRDARDNLAYSSPVAHHLTINCAS